MQPDQPYEDWKKELRIWEVTNQALGVDKIVQAGTLFHSLMKTPRDTVRSELTEEEITHKDGVKNIIKVLDYFYLGNKTQNAFNVIDDLMSFKCTPDLSLEDFIIQFQLKVNKVKSSGTILSDEILGYALLKAANLPKDKYDMVKLTCNELTYKDVKSQIEKIGLSKSKLVNKDNPLNVKVEQCFCSNLGANKSPRGNQWSDSSSDEDDNKATAYYAGRKNQSGSDASKQYKVNPTDQFGHVRACAFCKCHYHWLQDCPYAPVSIKNEAAFKSKFKRNHNHKTL